MALETVCNLPVDAVIQAAHAFQLPAQAPDAVTPQTGSERHAWLLVQ